MKQLEQPPFTLQHLRDRCRECGDCWEWASAYRAHRWPVISSRRDWDGDGNVRNMQFYVRHLMYWLAKGQKPRLGVKRALVPACGNPKCVNPDHLKIASRAEVGRTAFKPPGWAASVARGHRRRSKLSDEAVQEIRTSTERTLLLAERFGISQAYVYMIRNGEWRKDYSNPFAGLLAANDNGRRVA